MTQVRLKTALQHGLDLVMRLATVRSARWQLVADHHPNPQQPSTACATVKAPSLTASRNSTIRSTDDLTDLVER